MVEANALAYYDTATIKAVKCVTVSLSKNFFFVFTVLASISVIIWY
jgi:hypothetical protein